jgi:hypothetical protein
MRASLVCLVLAAASAAACVVGSLGAQAQEPRSAATEDTVKDVEVMRRVLVREGIGSRTSAALASVGGQNLDVYVAGWGGLGGASEAFVVRGQGATFVLRTSDAVSPGKGGEEPSGGAGAPSAWDEECAAVEGKTVSPTARRRASRYDAQKVDALKTRLLDALSKYGQKVRGLASSDRLTVIVVGGAGASIVEPTTVATTEDGKSVLRAAAYTSLWTHPGGEKTVLTLTVSVGDCQAAGAGSMSADDFRRRAVVSAY